LSKKVLLKRISAENIWINAYFTKIDTLKKLPYSSPSQGIYWEDWEWNINLLVNGIKQELVPNTFWVVYKRAKSLSTSHINSYRLLSMNSRMQLPKLKKYNIFKIRINEILLDLFFNSKLVRIFASKLLQFDSQFYALSNKDLSSYSRPLLIHYLLYGRNEGRISSENVFKKSELPMFENKILLPKRILGLSLGSFYNLN
jgi:GT2 family glycosyltransferase